MRRKILNIILSISILLGILFLAFPLPLIGMSFSKRIPITSVNMAVSLVNVYWENGILYNCTKCSFVRIPKFFFRSRADF